MRRIGLAVVLIVSLALGPLTVEAQQSGKLWRIGSLSTSPVPVPGRYDPIWLAFVQRLRELGYVEGQNLKEAIPKISRVAVLADPTNPTHDVFWRATESAAQTLRVAVQRVDVRAPNDIEGAFVTIGKARPDALVVFPEPMLYAQRKQIDGLARKKRLPTMYALRGHVIEGGLISYAPNYADLYRQTADYVDKVLKGAKPADLPFEEPTKFELIINLKTAKALGLTIPQSILLRADQVIE